MNFRSKSKAIVFGSRFSFKCDQEKPKRTTTSQTVVMFLTVSQVMWSPPNRVSYSELLIRLSGGESRITASLMRDDDDDWGLVMNRHIMNRHIMNRHIMNRHIMNRHIFVALMCGAIRLPPGRIFRHKNMAVHIFIWRLIWRHSKSVAPFQNLIFEKALLYSAISA